MITEKTVRSRLDLWGREFAYSRALVSLGHRSKDMLQVLIEHRGEMPPKVTGYKPEEVDLRAMEIEDMVATIGRESARMAWIMRAYFCGSGRRGVERFELAKALCLAYEGVEIALKPRGYYQAVEFGVNRVWGMLVVSTRTRRVA